MVYAKLDWFTVLMYHCSFKDILEKFHVYNEAYDQFLSEPMMRNAGYTTDVIFSSDYLVLSVDINSYIKRDDDIFATVWDKVRIDISGTKLDGLRAVFNEYEQDLDALLLTQEFFGTYKEDFTVTRADFAFDFVNHQGDFLDNLLGWIKKCEYDRNFGSGFNNSFYLGSNGRTSKYSYRCGSGEKCVYFGTVRSDKLLRIYDKKLEQTKQGVFIPPACFAEYGDREVDSWFRIELQTRRNKSYEVLYSCNGDLKNVLSYVFDNYLIHDPKTHRPLQIFLDLYDFKKLPKLICTK